MNLNMIALRNSFLDAFDHPTFTNLSRQDVVEQYRRSVLAAPQKAYEARASEKELWILGEFNDATGQVILLDKPVKLADLSSFFPKGFLARMESNNA